MNVFNLFAKLGLDRTEYEEGLKDAKQKGKEFTDDTKKKIGIISADAWVNLASKVLSVGKAIVQTSLDTLNYADQIGDLAGKWGFTTKEIQEFDYWATMNGTTLESLLTGMRGLVNQAEAGAGAFDKLGVKVKNNDGTFKSQRQLFLETIDALNKMTDQTERNALQFEIFGRAGIELGQVIGRDASELEALSQQAEDFGIILETETIDKAGDLNDVLDRLRLQGKSAFAELITGTQGGQEAFDEYIASLTEGIDLLAPVLTEAGTKLIGAFAKGLIKGIGGKIWEQVKFIAGEGWLWGDKTIGSAKEFFSKALFMDENFLSGGGGPKSSIFESQSNMSTSNDNSSYNFEVTMTSTNYTEQDARVIADEVIKQIATKKQARG